MTRKPGPHRKPTGINATFTAEMLPFFRERWESDATLRAIAAEATERFGFPIGARQVENLARRNFWYRRADTRNAGAPASLADESDLFVANWMRWAYPRPSGDVVKAVAPGMYPVERFSMLGGRCV